jgi:hypothetical protein
VETQFGWQRDVSYLRAWYADRTDAGLWQQAFGVDMPQPTLPQAGPVHKTITGPDR